MLPQWIIEKKRDGESLTKEEIEFLVGSYASGSLPDYQMAAFAMAVYFKGMTPREISDLTEAMMRSGDVVDTSSIAATKVDKHSTGGIGDKVSLILAPLAAACGLAVPMISGRGLGITGGTLDKLEAIPGYRTDLSERDLISVVEQCGCSIIGQTGQLAPADKKLYALRDVTGTVPSIPLIASSIMCKKLAEGLDGLVLDVKFGRGAFMKTLGEARDLAAAMVAVGKSHGKAMSALITDMNQPLGHAVGNAIEVWESVKVLEGEKIGDLLEITLELGASMLKMADPGLTRPAARERLEKAISSGAAREKFVEMVALHGGDTRTVEEPERLLTAKIREEIPSDRSGFVRSVDPDKVGRACIVLGGGRAKVSDTIDHAVGFTDIVKEGAKVERGSLLMTVHANDSERLSRARALLLSAVEIADTPPDPRPLVVEEV